MLSGEVVDSMGVEELLITEVGNHRGVVVVTIMMISGRASIIDDLGGVNCVQVKRTIARLRTS